MQRTGRWRAVALTSGAIASFFLSVAPDGNISSFSKNWQGAVSSIAANCASVAILAFLYWIATRQSAESEKEKQMEALRRLDEQNESIIIGISRMEHSLGHVLDQQVASKWLIKQIEKRSSRALAYAGGTGLFVAKHALPLARSKNHPIGVSLLLRPGSDPLEKLCASVVCLLLHHAAAKGNSVDMLSVEPGIADFRIDLTEEGALITPDGHAEETGLTAWLVPGASPLYQKLRGMIAGRHDAVGLRKSLSSTTLSEVISSKRAISPIFDDSFQSADFVLEISAFHVAASLGVVFDVLGRLGIAVPSNAALPSRAAIFAGNVVNYIRPDQDIDFSFKKNNFYNFVIKKWIEAECLLRCCSNNPKDVLREIILRIERESIPCQSHYNGFYKFYISGRGVSEFSVRLHVWVDSSQGGERAGDARDIHTHSWSFGSCVLMGSLRNTIWSESHVKKGVSYRKLSRHWDERSATYVHMLSSPKQPFYLVRCGNSDELLAGDIYWQRSDQLHSIEMKGGRIAATLVVHSQPENTTAASVMYRPAHIVDKSELPMKSYREQKDYVTSSVREQILCQLKRELSVG